MADVPICHHIQTDTVFHKTAQAQDQLWTQIWPLLQLTLGKIKLLKLLKHTQSQATLTEDQEPLHSCSLWCV